MMNRGLLPNEVREWRKIISRIPDSLRETFLDHEIGLIDETQPNFVKINNDSPPSLFTKTKVIPLLKATQREVLAAHTDITFTFAPPSIEGASHVYDLSKEDWLVIFSNAQKLTISTRIRSFAVQNNLGILYSNKDLERFGYINDAACNFCNNEPSQTRYHMMWSCPIVKTFREQVRNFAHAVFPENLTEAQWLYGKLDGSKAQNFIILFTNYYIYYSNHQRSNLNLDKFKAKLHYTYKIERQIADTRATPWKHISKWEDILPLIDEEPQNEPEIAVIMN